MNPVLAFLIATLLTIPILVLFIILFELSYMLKVKNFRVLYPLITKFKEVSVIGHYRINSHKIHIFTLDNIGYMASYCDEISTISLKNVLSEETFSLVKSYPRPAFLTRYLERIYRHIEEKALEPSKELSANEIMEYKNRYTKALKRKKKIKSII